MKKCKLLLLDLDGTLLQSDKTISTRTLSALKKCRENDILIGVSTSRSEQNSLVFLNELMPDILISSGGALVKYKTEYIYRAEFSEEETNVMIDMARNICGNDCEITIDTIDAHYWNYKIDPKKLDKSWGDSIYTDFSDFNECSLKMCVEIFNQDKADKLARSLSDCDCIRFSDGFWYKFTKKNVTKENAIMKITEVFLVELSESLMEIIQSEDIKLQRYPNENGKLKPCLRTIINCYGKTLFRNEIEFDLEKILSCLVNTRVNIMHIKINQRKPALDGRESVLYAIKMSYLYRLVILEKLEINAILYEDNLIKRVGYIDGWNGIQEQLFNRLKQFL